MKSNDAVFESTEDCEDGLAALVIVQQGNGGGVVESADGGAEPAHGRRLIADDFDSSADDRNLSLIFDFE